MLHNTSRLALLILREAHAGADGTSHRRSPSDIIGRGRMFALVYKPYKLALTVSQLCPCCVLDKAKQNPAQQKMGLLSQDCLTPSPPFSDVSEDLAGPFKLKYRERKTWILIYLCNISKALLVLQRYINTQVFRSFISA